MTENKPIMLKEVTETGFYCDVDDNERYCIFEVLNNPDEEWLKENPEQTLLIDERIYDYTDYDDRKVYVTSCNLVAVCNNTSTCKVSKIEDTKYKIFGRCGQFLIEDKPTYKEQLARKTQECEELTTINARLLGRLKVDETDTRLVFNLDKELRQKEKEFYTSIKKVIKLKQTLAEIKEIAEYEFKDLMNAEDYHNMTEILKQILQIIDEVE